jgi:DNA-binding winged helix-turn-helix (wHTH) protein
MTTESYVATPLPAAPSESTPPSESTAGSGRALFPGARPPLPALHAELDGDRRAAQVFGNLELRPDEMQALVAGTRVGLTVREFQVLAVLAAREDRVMRRAEIYRLVWSGEMKHRDRAVDVFVRKVRTKLAAAAPTWVYIHTHFGIGYRFAPEPSEGDAELAGAPGPARAPQPSSAVRVD